MTAMTDPASNSEPANAQRHRGRRWALLAVQSRLGSGIPYDRAIRQLRVSVRVLSAVLLALIARSVIDGATLALLLSEALIAVLLLASGALWRYGRRIEPHTRAHTPEAVPQARSR